MLKLALSALIDNVSFYTVVNKNVLLRILHKAYH
jgi:hypothetical protein